MMNNEASLADLDPESNYYNECLSDSEDSRGSRYISIESFMNKVNHSDATIMSYNIRSFNANSHSFLPLLHDLRFAPEVLVPTETWFRN